MPSMISRFAILTAFAAFALLTACGDASLNQAGTTATRLTGGNQAQSPGASGFQPGSRPPGGQMPGPMGLPPNLEEIRATYPELAAALEAMQDLDPEARRAQLETLFSEHPERREAMMPPGGMGPGGMPPGSMPPGGFGPGNPPPEGMRPPGPQPVPSPSAS